MIQSIGEQGIAIEGQEHMPTGFAGHKTSHNSEPLYEFRIRGDFLKASVILAHPYEKSFNHSIFARTVETLRTLKVEVYSHDLYKEHFNPVLSVDELGSDKSDDSFVKSLSKELISSNILLFIHPNWWGQPPAILKGYIDRVIRPPYAYDFPEGDSGGGLPIGKLKGKYGVVFNTSNTEELRERNYFGDPLENIWKKCIFGFCGIESGHRRMFRIIADSSHEQRQEWLDEVSGIVEKVVGEATKSI